MAKRAEYYENMDKEANEKLESATIKEAEYQKHMEELEAELDAKRKEAAKQADTMIQQSVNQAKEQAAKVMSDAKAAAMQERTKILDGAEQEIVQMAIGVCNRKDSCRQCIRAVPDAAERSTEDANSTIQNLNLKQHCAVRFCRTSFEKKDSLIFLKRNIRLKLN